MTFEIVYNNESKTATVWFSHWVFPLLRHTTSMTIDLTLINKLQINNSTLLDV